jgi:hypothetical protein
MTTDIDRNDTRTQLLGSWHLVSWSIADAESVIYPLGPEAIGQLSYDAAGRVSAQLARQHQSRFARDDWQRATTEEKSAAWSSYFGYFGTYTIDEDAHVVTHHIEGSWFPNLVGSEQARHYQLEDGRLVLDAETAWGRVSIVWEKNGLPVRATANERKTFPEQLRTVRAAE